MPFTRELQFLGTTRGPIPLRRLRRTFALPHNASACDVLDHVSFHVSRQGTRAARETSRLK